MDWTKKDDAVLIKRIWDRVTESPGVASSTLVKEFSDVPAHRVHTLVRMLSMRGQLVRAGHWGGLHVHSPETEKLDHRWNSKESVRWRQKLTHCLLRTDGRTDK